MFAKRIRARCASGEPADGQPVPSDSSTAAKLFDVSACCHVRSCAWLARRARVVCACRACSARACSCARRSAASAGVAVARRSPVRDMPLCALFFALAQKLFCARANTRSVHIPHAASKPHRQPTSPRSWLVLLGPEAAYIGGDGGAVGDAALSRVDGHGAQAIHGGSKRKEEDQKDGSTASSTRAARRR